MARSELIEFEILWYAGGPEWAPNRCIGREHIRKRDLTAAITTACNMLKAGKGCHDGYAHGFYVRKAPAQLQTTREVNR
jgi:hypothetical protein